MGPLTRVQGWESLLARHIESAPPFRWGTNDCALWAARWVLTATGVDFLSEWQGKYSTEVGAKRLMTRRGFASVAAIADEHLTDIPVAFAGRGDLLLHPIDGCLGICAGVSGYFLTDGGVTAVTTAACPRAWKV